MSQEADNSHRENGNGNIQSLLLLMRTYCNLCFRERGFVCEDRGAGWRAVIYSHQHPLAGTIQLFPGSIRDCQKKIDYLISQNANRSDMPPNFF
jgi:hypothetical protein